MGFTLEEWKAQPQAVRDIASRGFMSGSGRRLRNGVMEGVVYGPANGTIRFLTQDLFPFYRKDIPEIDKWANVLGHPTELARPGGEGSSYGPREKAYTFALNVGKRAFLSEVGERLRETTFIQSTDFEYYGDEEGQLGFRLFIPGSFLPFRPKLGLASVGIYDHDLRFFAKHTEVIKAINDLAPKLEAEIATLDKNSDLSPHRVRIVDLCGYIASPEKVDKYLARYRPNFVA